MKQTAAQSQQGRGRGDRENEMNDNWQDVFGNEVSALEIARSAEESNVTVADWLHSTYLAMFAENTEEMAENLDFEELGNQVVDEAEWSEKALEEADGWEETK